MMLKMFRELARRCKGARDIYTIGGIRQAINQEIRKLRIRKRNKLLPVSEVPEMCLVGEKVAGDRRQENEGP